jgi:hypothetical protein
MQAGKRERFIEHSITDYFGSLLNPCGPQSRVLVAVCLAYVSDS